MNKQQEALKLALEALEKMGRVMKQSPDTEKAIAAIREALADSALDRMADNARELGLDYEPPCKTGSQCTSKCQQCEQPTQDEDQSHYKQIIDDVREVFDTKRKQTTQQQEPVAWINWCAATGKRSVSFECESELASEPLYAGITQNTQYHYSKFHSWFDSELHRKKYTKDHPAYLAAQEAWNAANDAAQHRINRLNAEIEAWKVRFKIAEDALAKLNGPEQKPVAYGLFVNGELSWDSEWAFSNESFPVQFDDEECLPLYTSPPASKCQQCEQPAQQSKLSFWLEPQPDDLELAAEQSDNYAAFHAGYRFAVAHSLTEQPAPVAEPHKQQEPLFWYRPCSNGMYEGPIHNAQIERIRKESGAWVPLYTSPPASKPWVGLSTDEIYDMYNEPRSDAEMVEFARAIEAKLKERNT